jgi:hypothetical protein
MSVKTVSDSDTGDSTHVGGADWNKHARYFNGTANVLTISGINTDTPYLDNRLKLKNGSFNCSIRTTSVNANFDLFPPTPAGVSSDTILSGSNVANLFNKTIAAWDNNLAGTLTRPSVKKWGTIQCGGVTGGGAGDGLLYGFLDMPAIPIRGSDPTYGSYWRYNTTATINTPTGTRVPARWILKEYLPFYRCKIRPSTTTNTRFYFGLSYETSIPATDTPTDNPEACLLVGWRSNDSGIVVISNAGPSGGAGTSPTVTTVPNVTKASISNQVRQFEIAFVSTTSCIVRVLDGNGASQLGSATVSTNLPQDAMCPSCVLSNTSTAPVDFDIFFEELEQLR